MKIREFDYYLPKKFIAQKPIRPRDHSRLLILERKTGKIKHDYFFNLGKYLKKGDVLVLNNSRVFPARLIGYKSTGGKVEVLLIRELKNGEWKCLVRGKTRALKRVKCLTEHKILFCAPGKKFKLSAQLTKKLPDGMWQIKFDLAGKKLKEVIYKIGQAPTPPYIKRISNLKEYQTIYAKKEGSIAAPTAGFHFTNKLIVSLKRQGIKFKFITLHVGLGTFLPIKSEKIEKHKMLAERVVIDKKTAADLNKTKNTGGRIIAIGTSTVRSLESAIKDGKVCSFNSQTNLFIKPGYKFSTYGACPSEAGRRRGSAVRLSSLSKSSGGKFINGLITNFHLPKSTNLVLVSTFASRKNIFKAYQEAIKRKYRFYSFGDVMLIT